MSTVNYNFKSGNQSSKNALPVWRMIQFLFWLVGVCILICLIFFPPIGTLLLWNILIPIAPLLIVVALGVWRNICPLATTNLLPRHFGLSQKKRLSQTQSGKLNLIGVCALYLIVPLRHAIFNTNGPATAALIIIMAVIGFCAGLIYEWKSVWCSGLCPIHPVEKLYGGNVLFSVPNAHCKQCENCVIPCPDSTPNMHPSLTEKTIFHRISAMLIIGGFPGFIWGWFHVPDEVAATTIKSLLSVYKFPFIGFVVTLSAYLIINSLLTKEKRRLLTRIFAASAVSCYYWFRIPSLIGFGKFANDGLLINLKNVLPIWIPYLIVTMLTIFFFIFLVLRKENNFSWVIRPEYAVKKIS